MCTTPFKYLSLKFVLYAYLCYNYVIFVLYLSLIVLCFVGLTAQSTILAYLFFILENGQVTVQLSPDLPAAQNVQFVQNFMLGLLKSAFPNLLE